MKPLREEAVFAWRAPLLGALVLVSCASVLGIEEVHEGSATDSGGAPNVTSGAPAIAGAVAGAAGGAAGHGGAAVSSTAGRGGAAAGGPEAGGNAGTAEAAGASGETERGGGPAGGAPSAGGGKGGASPAGSGGAVVCEPNETRCTEAGRETCTASGIWSSTPCPPNTPTCEGGACVVRGPTMVKVSGFYIDSTEVTVAQYQQFLDDKGTDTSGQPEVCRWNTAYDDPSVPHFSDDEPRTYVDWCDALAFCTWAGKRLCGRIGGGAATREELFQSASSEWFLTCGGPQGATHPRLNAVCNYSGALADVASYPQCEGYYPGVFDMEGNAREWVDSCDGTTGANDTCRLMGSGAVDSSGYCDTLTAEYARNYKAMPFGFRCCSQ